MFCHRKESKHLMESMNVAKQTFKLNCRLLNKRKVFSFRKSHMALGMAWKMYLMIFSRQFVFFFGDNHVQTLPLHLGVVPLLAPLDRALNELKEFGFAWRNNAIMIEVKQVVNKLLSYGYRKPFMINAQAMMSLKSRDWFMRIIYFFLSV